MYQSCRPPPTPFPFMGQGWTRCKTAYFPRLDCCRLAVSTPLVSRSSGHIRQRIIYLYNLCSIYSVNIDIKRLYFETFCPQGGDGLLWENVIYLICRNLIKATLKGVWANDSAFVYSIHSELPAILHFIYIYFEFQSMERILYLWDKYSNICDTMSP